MRIFAVVILALLASPGRADLVIMALGDSVGANTVHRSTLSAILDADGISHSFVGDRTDAEGGYQAWGGMRLEHVLDGWTIDRGSGPIFEAGAVDALTRFAPNVFLVLGGYNDMASGNNPRAETDYGDLIDYLVAYNPLAHIFVSNVTDFDPNKTWAHRRQNVLDFNAFLATDTATRQTNGERVHLVDNFSSVTYADLADDGLHVLSSGHQKIGANWHDAIVAVPEASAAACAGCAFAVALLFHRRRTPIARPRRGS